MQASLSLTATPEQQEIIQSKAKVICLLAGRRWGKSIGVVRNRIIYRSLMQPGFRYLLVAPSMGQVEPEYGALVAEPTVMAHIAKCRERPYPIIHWHNGSVTKFRSLERPDLLRRDGVDEVWVDEVQNSKERDIDAVLLPMLADRRGTLGMSGQPRGSEHWIYRRFFAPGQNKENWKRQRSWRYSITDGVMFQTAEGREEIERLKALTPARIWEQEYLALPTANSQAVFRNDDLKTAMRGEAQTGPIANHRYIVSVDLGRVVDPTSIVIFDATQCSVAYTEIRPHREKHDITAPLVNAMSRRWHSAPVIIDATGYGAGSANKADEYVRHYQIHVPSAYPFQWNVRTKQRIVERAALMIEQQKIGIPASLTDLHHQLSIYEFQARNDHIVYGAPDGEHDDLCAALFMALDAHARGFGAAPVAANLSSIL
jgi:hypothetical protein